MLMTELPPETAAPPPQPDAGWAPGDEDLWCFLCLCGTCKHKDCSGGHAESAMTLFKGTALCFDCARTLARMRLT